MNKLKNTKNKLFLKLTGGLLVGLVNGFFGGGGGMIAVPFMIYLLNEEEKVAHATAIFIILPLSVVSGIIYITSGIVEWDKLIPVLIGVLVGGIFGAICLNKIKGKTIGIIFAVTMIIAGIRMLF